MVIELANDAARAVIYPEHGGRLHQFSVRIDGAEVPLLSSPADPGAYRDEPMRGGSFPMAPWPNRIADGEFTFEGKAMRVSSSSEHALHGTVFEASWQVVARTARVVEMVCPLGERWPWAGRAWQRFELTPTSLIMKLEVRSEREPFPAGCGWHPWFLRDVLGSGDARLTLNAGYRYLQDGQIPTGERVAPSGDYDLSTGVALGSRRLDDCYGRISGPPLIDWGRLRLRVSNECLNPHFHVYTEPDAFCLEPQTCAPDSFNLSAAEVTGTGMAIASPGRAVAITSRWTWELPAPA